MCIWQQFKHCASQVFLDANTKSSFIYQKDFFHRLFEKLVSTNSKMFQFNDAKTLTWFPTTVRLFFFFLIWVQLSNHVTLTSRGISVDHFLLLLPQVTPEDRKTFYLFGVLCGLALYNRNVIQLPFPLALFKKLVDAKPTLDDMKEFQPSVGRSV